MDFRDITKEARTIYISLREERINKNMKNDESKRLDGEAGKAKTKQEMDDKETKAAEAERFKKT